MIKVFIGNENGKIELTEEEFYEIFEWYEKYKDMNLHEKTRMMIEDILGDIKAALDEDHHLENYGLNGLKV